MIKRITMDTKSYKALRIVLMHWIKPSITARKHKSSTIIARWWIRISGSHRGFNLVKPYSPIIESFPPGLYRQTNCCLNLKNNCKVKICRNYYKRWSKRNTFNAIKTLHIQKYCEENEEIPYHVMYSEFGVKKMEMYFKSGWMYDSNLTCACNLIPAYVIINYKEMYGSMEHIFRIMAEDTIPSRTRSHVSLYIQNRLTPNPM
jgi:hypothetical protein